MKKYIFVCVILLSLSGCKKPVPPTNPLTTPYVQKACKGELLDFEQRIQSLSPEDQAQFVALTETIDERCASKFEWMHDIVSNAYRNYGAAFYAINQPWSRIRAERAFEDMLSGGKNRSLAKAYLSAYVDEWKDKPWAMESLSLLDTKLEESDEIFSLLAQVADEKRLARMSELPPTESRDAALIYRWPQMPPEARQRALSAWVSARWSMQTSGSSQLPQYITFDWQKKPLPEHVPDFIVTSTIETLRINNKEVKRRDLTAKTMLYAPPLKEAGTRHRRVDLNPWLAVADKYRVSGKAAIQIWKPDVDEACLNHEDSCKDKPMIVMPVEFDQSYRVFVGVETGAPRRHRDDKQNRKISKSLKIDMCNETTCIPLWDGKKTTNRPQLPVLQGHDFYLKTTVDHSELPIAARLMARPGEGKVWREVATFFTYEPQSYQVPVRADIDLNDLCGQSGPCKLELELRPSLRLARRDPRIARYWGDTLQLGTVSFDLQNQTGKQIWSVF